MFNNKNDNVLRITIKRSINIIIEYIFRFT